MAESFPLHASTLLTAHPYALLCPRFDTAVEEAQRALLAAKVTCDRGHGTA